MNLQSIPRRALTPADRDALIRRQAAKAVNFGMPYGADTVSMRELHLRLANYFYSQALILAGDMFWRAAKLGCRTSTPDAWRPGTAAELIGKAR